RRLTSRPFASRSISSVGFARSNTGALSQDRGCQTPSALRRSPWLVSISPGVPSRTIPAESSISITRSTLSHIYSTLCPTMPTERLSHILPSVPRHALQNLHQACLPVHPGTVCPCPGEGRMLLRVSVSCRLKAPGYSFRQGRPARQLQGHL